MLRKPDQYKTEKGTPLKTDILHAPLPEGPEGQFGMHTFNSHVMPSYTKNEKAAKDLLRFIHAKENYEQWFTTGQGFYTPARAAGKPKLWKQNPVMAPFAVAGQQGLTPGYPGEPNAKAAEVLTKYLIGNMFGRHQGPKAEDAVAARGRAEEDLRLRHGGARSRLRQATR